MDCSERLWSFQSFAKVPHLFFGETCVSQIQVNQARVVFNEFCKIFYRSLSELCGLVLNVKLTFVKNWFDGSFLKLVPGKVDKLYLLVLRENFQKVAHANITYITPTNI